MRKFLTRPKVGRFISADTTDVLTASPTALTDKNLYAYCDNNPVMRADSSAKLLGFFSSEEKCQEMISFYLTQPGFEKYPDDFIIEEIEADVDDFNKVSGEFEKCVYFLSHEWYDGVYDYVSSIGYYSTLKKAEEAEKKYRLAPEFVEHQEGFIIDEYKIGEREWKEGF